MSKIRNATKAVLSVAIAVSIAFTLIVTNPYIDVNVGEIGTFYFDTERLRGTLYISPMTHDEYLTDWDRDVEFVEIIKWDNKTRKASKVLKVEKQLSDGTILPPGTLVFYNWGGRSWKNNQFKYIALASGAHHFRFAHGNERRGYSYADAYNTAHDVFGEFTNAPPHLAGLITTNGTGLQRAAFRIEEVTLDHKKALRVWAPGVKGTMGFRLFLPGLEDFFHTTEEWINVQHVADNGDITKIIPENRGTELAFASRLSELYILTNNYSIWTDKETYVASLRRRFVASITLQNNLDIEQNITLNLTSSPGGINVTEAKIYRNKTYLVNDTGLVQSNRSAKVNVSTNCSGDTWGEMNDSVWTTYCNITSWINGITGQHNESRVDWWPIAFLTNNSLEPYENITVNVTIQVLAHSGKFNISAEGTFISIDDPFWYTPNATNISSGIERLFSRDIPNQTANGIIPINGTSYSAFGTNTTNRLIYYDAGSGDDSVYYTTGSDVVGYNESNNFETQRYVAQQWPEVYTSGPRLSNLPLWLPADDDNESTIIDMSGNENDGTVVNIGTSSPGIIGSGLNLSEAGSEYITFGFDPLGGRCEITFEGWYLFNEFVSAAAWIKSTAVGGHEVILIRSPSSAAHQLYLCNEADSCVVAQYGETLNTAQWYHMAYTYDCNAGAGNLKIYINGTEVKNATQTGNIKTDAATFKFGEYSSGAYRFDGTIDDQKIYNITKTSEEINASYHATLNPYLGPEVNWYDLYSAQANFTVSGIISNTSSSEGATVSYNLTGNLSVSGYTAITQSEVSPAIYDEAGYWYAIPSYWTPSTGIIIFNVTSNTSNYTFFYNNNSGTLSAKNGTTLSDSENITITMVSNITLFTVTISHPPNGSESIEAVDNLNFTIINNKSEIDTAVYYIDGRWYDEHHPEYGQVDVGTLLNDSYRFWDALKYPDNRYINILETVTSPAVVFPVNISGVQQPNFLTWLVYYGVVSGSPHNQYLDVSVWNFNSSSWYLCNDSYTLVKNTWYNLTCTLNNSFVSAQPTPTSWTKVSHEQTGSAINHFILFDYVAVNSSNIIIDPIQNTTFHIHGDGTYNITLVVNDTNGNVTSDTVFATYHVDNLFANVINPQNISYNDSTINYSYFNASITDNASNVILALNISGASVNHTATIDNVTRIVSYQNNTFAEGLNHQACFWGNDPFGQSWHSDIVTFTYDNTVPHIVTTNVTNGSYYNSDPITIQMNCSDNLLCSQAWIQNASGIYGLGGANETASITFGEGLAWIIIGANDTANNVNSSANISFIIDTVAPAVTIYSPTNTTYFTAELPLNLSVSDVTTDEDARWYNLNGGINTTFIGNTTINVINGSNTLVVYVNDSAGNINVTTIYFTAIVPDTKIWVWNGTIYVETDSIIYGMECNYGWSACTPDYQGRAQPIIKVQNNGTRTAIGGMRCKVNETVSGITPKMANSSSYTSAFSLTTSLTTIYAGNVTAGQNLSCWIWEDWAIPTELLYIEYICEVF